MHTEGFDKSVRYLKEQLDAGCFGWDFYLKFLVEILQLYWDDFPCREKSESAS